MAADTDDNVTIVASGGNTASIATDYGTTGDAGTFLTHHVQVNKIAWGSDTTTNRVSATSPLPVSLYGITGGLTLNAISNAYVRNVSGTYLEVAGISGAAVSVTDSGANTKLTTISNSLNTGSGTTFGVLVNTLADTFTSGGGGYVRSASVAFPIFSRIIGGNTTASASIDTSTGVNALYVSLAGGSFSITANIASTVAVINDVSSPLKIQGYTGGNPVIVTGTTIESTLSTISTNAAYLGNTINTNVANISTYLSGGTGKIKTMPELVSTVSTGSLATTTSFQRLTSITSIGVTYGVQIKSAASNRYSVYVTGNTGTTGFQMDPGEKLFIEISNPYNLFVKSDTAATTVYYLAY